MGDIIILLVIVLSSFIGMKRGLLKTLTGVLSTVMSVVLSMVFYRPVSKILESSPLMLVIEKKTEEFFLRGDASILSKVGELTKDKASALVMDAISFILVIVLVKIILLFLIKAVRFTAKLPVIKELNALLGGVLGFVGGVIICYILIEVSDALSVGGILKELDGAFDKSILASFFYKIDII